MVNVDSGGVRGDDEAGVAGGFEFSEGLAGEAWSLVVPGNNVFPQLVQNVHLPSFSSPQLGQRRISFSAPPHDPQNRKESGNSRLHSSQCFIVGPAIRKLGQGRLDLASIYQTNEQSASPANISHAVQTARKQSVRIASFEDSIQQTYYVCSKHCLQKFRDDHLAFIRGSAQTPEAHSANVHPSKSNLILRKVPELHACPMHLEVRKTKPYR